MNNCLWVTLFDAVLKDLPKQKTGLYLFENQGWEMALLWAWRKHGHGRIIGVPHATVPFWHLYYFDDVQTVQSKEVLRKPSPDYLAVNGPMARNAFSNQGYGAERLVEVEALRYLRLSMLKPIPQQDELGSVESRIPSQNSSLKRRVLILGDMLPTSMHYFLDALQKCVRLLPAKYSFTFKPHPGMRVDLSRYAELEVGETTDALDRIIGDYDIALVANGTSASADAYIAGLPVVIFHESSHLNLNPLRGLEHVHFASTPLELAEALSSLRRREAAKPNSEDLFYLDAELPRWKCLMNHLG